MGRRRRPTRARPVSKLRWTAQQHPPPARARAAAPWGRQACYSSAPPKSASRATGATEPRLGRAVPASGAARPAAGATTSPESPEGEQAWLRGAPPWRAPRPAGRAQMVEAPTRAAPGRTPNERRRRATRTPPQGVRQIVQEALRPQAPTVPRCEELRWTRQRRCRKPRNPWTCVPSQLLPPQQKSLFARSHR